MTRTLVGNGLVVRTTAPTEEQVYATRMSRYHASALAGIQRTWREAEQRGGGIDPRPLTVASAGPSCFIANKPRSMAPCEPKEFAPVSLLSKNGKHLPLRAIPFRDLNREFWSQGKVVNVDALERQQSRELLAHEKPVESMTLSELIATQNREPLTESKRSWLTRGAGVMSLAPWDAYEEGSIGAMVTDPTAQAALEAVCEDRLGQLELENERDSERFGTPYDRLDPITAKQIDWEQRQHGNGPVIRVTVGHKEDGGLTIKTDRKLIAEDLMKVARNVKRTLLAESETNPFSAPDWQEERDRFLAPADAEWHASYEEPHPVVAILSDAPSDYPCPRRGCITQEQHRHTRIRRIVHRGTRRGHVDELWHNRLFDVTAFELGTDGLVDQLAEAI